ncbi:MAG: M28 family peptidase, partial [Spirochaetales bacterium]|nr:M28 family peptidase [Spirochaetales bacterium]
MNGYVSSWSVWLRIAALAAILGAFPGCAPAPREEITAFELSSHVQYLASDALQGRYTGTPGIGDAERYIADVFAGLGLSPLPGEEDFFLEFDLKSTSYDPEETVLLLDGTGYALGEDFRPFPFSADGIVESEVVFAGYGITAPEYRYDDYAGLDVRGKIVLIMRHEPDETGTTGIFEGARQTRHAYFREKAENAAKHGALGMLLYTDPLNHPKGEDLRVSPVYAFTNASGSLRVGSGSPVADGFVAFHVSRPAVQSLLPGVDLEELQKAVDAGQAIPVIREIADLAVTARMVQSTDNTGNTVQARNIAAFLPGRDHAKTEWIVVGAHHDHIGSFTGDGDTIYNGADDNASGVAGLLELAEQFAAYPADRPMAFMTFSAEEIGLFGSYALDRYDLIDFENIGFMLNLDMIGRNPDIPVEIYGDGLAEGLTDLVLEANEKHMLEIDLQGQKYVPFSDIAVFHDNRVPFLMFFTGEHPDYHGTGDHWEKLDYERMEKLIRLSYDILDLA